MADSTNQTLPINPPGWLKECLSMCLAHPREWASDWIKSLQASINEADATTITWGYQQLIEQFNKLLEESTTAPESQNAGVSRLLKQLIVMQIYLQVTVKLYSDQLFKTQVKQWKEYVNSVIKIIPNKAFTKHLSLIVSVLHEKQPINYILDSALLKVHQHGLIVYFQQLLDWLRNNVSQDCTCPEEENNVFKSYIHMISRLHDYTQVSTLPSSETAQLLNQLLDQLTQIIKSTYTLNLSPSWIARLWHWTQSCFNKLKSFCLMIPQTTKKSSWPLLIIIRRLRKLTEKVARNKKNRSFESIRKHCWLYFSLYSHIYSHWGATITGTDAEECLSIGKILFECFMITFKWPWMLNKSISKENPFKSHGFFWFKRKQIISVNPWENLVVDTLNYLGMIFMSDWHSSRYPFYQSFLGWLLSQHKACLDYKVKDYLGIGIDKIEINYWDKINIYRLMQVTHEKFCNDLTQIIQLILSVWFQEIGIVVNYNDLANYLSKPGHWIYQKNHIPRKSYKNVDSLAYEIYYRMECLIGLHFFPKLQQDWLIFEEKWIKHSENEPAFILQYHTAITAILKKLLLIFHPDHQSEAFRENSTQRELAQCFIKQIQLVKSELRNFIDWNPDDLQSYNVEEAASSVLQNFKKVVFDSMQAQAKTRQVVVSLLSSSLKQLQTYNPARLQFIKETEQECSERILELRERKKIRKETEEALAEVERLKKALLALDEGFTEQQLPKKDLQVALYYPRPFFQIPAANCSNPDLTGQCSTFTK